MTYDVLRDRVILFGGITGGVFRANTWEFDGQDWTDRGTSPLAPRTFPSLAYVLALGKTILFSGFGGTGIYHPGTWEYQTNALATYTTSGTGCAGSAGVPRVDALQLPWIGETFEFDVSSLGANAQPFAFVGFSKTAWAGGALPFPLTVLGAPQCDLLVSPDAAVSALAPVSLPVPNASILLGNFVYVQAIAVEPGFKLSLSARGEAQFGAL
jgi:hypothetical protein